MTTPPSAFPVEIEPMTPEDCARAAELSGSVGWPHRLEDWRFVLSVGAGLCARTSGTIIATAMWWEFGPVARLGMVIVDPERQGAGVGRMLMEAVLQRIEAPTVFLTATEAGKPLYRKLGFESIGTLVQHQGVASSAPPVALRDSERIRPMERDDEARLVELDAGATGARREQVIAELIEQGDAIVLEEDGEIVGFAFCRRFGRGHVIGPVVACDAAGARALIAHWVGSHSGMFVRVDVTGESGLSPWLDELGFARLSPILVMRRGPATASPGGAHVYAIVNQALG